MSNNISTLQERFSNGKAIRERLETDPISYGKPLRKNLNGYRRLRVGRYRIIYKIDPKNSKEAFAKASEK
jgi:mRNA-degrading endonuclease RelE of RelBE toxin-antitoxin system